MIIENNKNKKKQQQKSNLFVREIEEILEMEMQRKNKHGTAATLVLV